MAAWLTLPSPLTHQVRSEEEKHAQDDRERQWKKERMRRLKRKR
jgi:hypothetical protein